MNDTVSVSAPKGLAEVIPAKRLRGQPFGTAYVYPSDSKHGVSISLPTWESTIAYFEKTEAWKNKHIEWCYPRFFVNRPIRELADLALQRLNIAKDTDISCLLFPTVAAAQSCVRHIAKDHGSLTVDIAHFRKPDDIFTTETGRVLDLASFAMAIFPKEAKGSAMMFWVNVGGGLTTRHAMFSKGYIYYLEAEHSNKKSNPQPPKSIDLPLSTVSWMNSTASTSMCVKSRIAKLSTPENATLPQVTADDVTLYPTGMNAIYHASEALASVATTSTVVAFGWIYDETIYNLKNGSWGKFIGYKQGTEQNLEDLTNRLKAGERIGALFCELPSNVFLSSPPLQRLRDLADEYGFYIACDDTVAGFVNLDPMPYVDVMMTSLTKIFSGASDVTGGNLIVNPASRAHDLITAAIQARYEHACVFPLDIETLEHNSRHLVWRAKRCNKNTLPVVQMLKSHPLIKRVNHPSIDESLPIYKSLMRKNGGYGNVLSIIFHDERIAHHFYDNLDLPKGSSFGTNFTIAVPFALLVHYYNRDKVAAHGLPEHIIRISIGLENVEEIKEAIWSALAKCTGQTSSFIASRL
ncbi:hypothetical protein EYB26_004452 [Talaromyces marneffei]|uniref:uncharacterized protein n=1 Tax=Talaromyces marneffei TaxID=37727 RepID=UPI0012A8A5B2|nr:uncharacterized protein EYB26_004452 [Talaromyces marneffei]QGA16782.1 hypothetical protein EYB26_004452 [Talaromyces marneffei]